MIQLLNAAQITISSLTQWVAMEAIPETGGMEDRCTVERLQPALAAIAGARVVSAAVNRTGVFDPPSLSYDLPQEIPSPPPQQFSDLPAFCDVRVDLTGPYGHVAHLVIWVPLAWNGRFLGTTGGGNRTTPAWVDLPFARSITPIIALRNGFATAATDGANHDRRMADWGLDDAGKLDLELVRNWVDRSTHEMTLVGKAITEALHGTPPCYSYLQGCSGGGRQAMASAQQYPEDYDGIWSSDPAINWTRTMTASLWPAVVMNEAGNPLAPAKLDAFRAAAIEANDGVDGLKDGIIGAFDPCNYDPHKLVGTETDAGEITSKDAEVMRRIWEGPRRADGSILWSAPRPCVRTSAAMMMCATREVDGKLEPVPLMWGPALFRWTVGDPNFDWKMMTVERYIELSDRAIEQFSWIDSNETDLSRFQDRGAKLILSQAADDEILMYQPTVDYFRGVIDAMGGEEATSSFARLFVTDGDVHGLITGPGPGLTIAETMAALMRWVENGEAPERMVAHRMDLATMSVVTRRPVYPYPIITRYTGHGDAVDAESYIGVRR